MQTAILVSLLAVFFSFLESKGYFKYGLVAAISFITVFCAIRYGWGTDLDVYYTNYQAFTDPNISVFDFDSLAQIRDSRSYEMGWAILNVLCRPIGFFGLIILLAVVEGLILYDVIKKYVDKKYYWLAVYIYTMNPYMMVLGCSMLRQWLAICIVLFAIRYIISGRFVIYTLLVLLAASFHTSAILFITLYLFRYVRNSRFTKETMLMLGVIALIWLFVGGLIAQSNVGALLNIVAFEGYDTYIAEGGMGGSFGFGGFFKIFLALFCVSQASRLSKEKAMWCILLLMYIFLFPMTNAILLANRLNLYIEAIGILAIPIAFKSNNVKWINIFIIILLVLFNGVLYIGFFNSPSFNASYAVYHTIFEAPSWQ